jgi:hypothetical protein
VNQARQSFEKQRLLSLPIKNAVIDRVKSLDEDGCTVLSFIDGGYNIV